MSTTANVLTTLSDRVVKREFLNKMAILVGDRHYPRFISEGLKGYKLGLHAPEWHEKPARHSGDASYFVRVVPMFSDISDPDGLPLMGTPSVENTTQGTTFTFDPYPDGYACNGYRVYAGTTTGLLFYQGELANRFLTTFTIGTTWSYVEVTSLTPQTIGPPAFATALEVYQSQGAVDSRIFLGGGKSYQNGYAQVATASTAPLLTGGTAAESDYAVWEAITDASFKMRLGWAENSLDFDELFCFDGIDFTGISDMDGAAGILQAAIRAERAPVLHGGTVYTSSITTWQAITDGSFRIFASGVSYDITGCDFSGETDHHGIASVIQTQMQAAGGNLAAATCTWDSDATRFIIKANQENPTALHLLSYLYQHSAGTGTDISAHLDATEDSDTAVLYRRGKGATTDQTVTWDTDHFIFTDGTNTGNQYRLSFASEVTANVGTDISTASYLDCLSTSLTATYTPGKTAKRTVTGVDTEWGEWCAGMKFRAQDESNEVLIARYFDEDHILLDSDYVGSASGTWAEYIFLPFDDQVYTSALGNPFKFSATDIVRYPTADSDGIKAIRRNGTNVCVFMRHHVWMIDGVNLSEPQMISNYHGVPNDWCIIEYGEGLLWFNGKEFSTMVGGRIQNLDPENRMADLISRVSPYTPDYHGVYLKDTGRDLIKWFIGLDSSKKYDMAIVFQPSIGSWWVENHKDANASAIIKDKNDKQYLITGQTYDEGHSIPAFTFLHGNAYKNDGASQASTNTKEGLIGAVGAATTTAGYLTCGTISAALATWQAVTRGYFRATIDGTDYDIGPIDFSGISDMDGAATVIQTAIRAETDGSETCVYSTDHFVITSGTTTNQSNISYLGALNTGALGATDISGKDYMNGREGWGAVTTNAVTQIALTLQDWDGNDAVLSTGSDGEKGIFVYVCDTNLRNGQYARVVSNTATVLTVSPNFSTAPSAGWYWYLGGIVPIWYKWFDFGNPQHKHKLHGVAMTVRPGEDSDGNRIAFHELHDLVSTIRATKIVTVGGSADTTSRWKLNDRSATQIGLKMLRPSATKDLIIDDITLTHRTEI